MLAAIRVPSPVAALPFLPDLGHTDVTIALLTGILIALTIMLLFVEIPGAIESYWGVRYREWRQERQREKQARPSHTLPHEDFFNIDNNPGDDDYTGWRVDGDLPGDRMTRVGDRGVRISVPTSGHNLWPVKNFNAPRLLRRASGDFTATAHLRFGFKDQIQGAGLLLWRNKQNFWRLNYMTWWNGQHYVALEGSYRGTYSTVSRKPIRASELYFRLKYSSIRGRVTAFYSTDVSHTAGPRRWVKLHHADFNPEGPFDVGVFVMNEWTENSPCYADIMLFDLDHH